MTNKTISMAATAKALDRSPSTILCRRAYLKKHYKISPPEPLTRVDPQGWTFKVYDLEHQISWLRVAYPGRIDEATEARLREASE